MNNRIFQLIWGCLAALVLMAADAAADPLSVVVSIAPQRYFVQQIGKELVSVRVMVQPGASPATYEPKPAQMAAIAKAKLYLAIGVPFEHVWLKKISAANPGLQVVATDQNVQKRPMATHAHRHNHDRSPHPEADDSTMHGDNHLDPHIWLAPLLVKKQAREIADALQQIDPANQDAYEANYQQFATRLSLLDRELREMFAGLGNRKFLVFHPSWGYFAQAYGLIQVPVEIEGKHPKPAQLKALIEHARHEKIKVIFVQPQFSTKSAKLIAASIGGRIVVADPLAEDWAANLRRQALNFKTALR